MLGPAFAIESIPETHKLNNSSKQHNGSKLMVISFTAVKTNMVTIADHSLTITIIFDDFFKSTFLYWLCCESF